MVELTFCACNDMTAERTLERRICTPLIMNRILSTKDSDRKLGSAAVANGEPHTSQKR